MRSGSPFRRFLAAFVALSLALCEPAAVLAQTQAAQVSAPVAPAAVGLVPTGVSLQTTLGGVSVALTPGQAMSLVAQPDRIALPSPVINAPASAARTKTLSPAAARAAARALPARLRVTTALSDAAPAITAPVSAHRAPTTARESLDHAAALPENASFTFDHARRADDPALAAPALTTFGTPGPGVSDEHSEALQALADKSGLSWFVAGSRQTGRRKDGRPFGYDSDLDLGIIGDEETFLRGVQTDWKGVPNAGHFPIFRRASIDEAVADGYFVVSPRPATPPPAAPTPQEQTAATDARWSRLKTIAKAAGVVAVLDIATKVAAHVLGSPDMHAIEPDLLWRAGTFALFVFPAAGLAIPALLTGLAKRFRLPERAKEGMALVAKAFPWILGVVLGGSLVNGVEGALFGAVTNPFVLAEMAFNLADQAIFAGGAALIQATGYLWSVYRWGRQGAKRLHPVTWPWVLGLSAVSAAVGYALAPALSNREFLGGPAEVAGLLASAAVLAQLIPAMLVSWAPGAWLRAKLLQEVGIPGLLAASAPWRTALQLKRLDYAPRAPGERFSFAVLGDAEPGRFRLMRMWFRRGAFARLIDAINGQKIDFTMQLGDMVSRGHPWNFDRFFRHIEAAPPHQPYLTTIGNHDRRKPHGVTDSKLYEALFGETNYHFDRGGVRFVILDSSANRVTKPQLEWLDRALDTDMPKIVFTHVPPKQLRPWTDWGGVKGVGGFKTGSKEFTELVAKRGVSRVYMGHIHGFGTQDYLGVRYVLSGGGGSPLYPSPVKDRFHHFIEVQVEGGKLIETVHRADGTTFEIP